MFAARLPAAARIVTTAAVRRAPVRAFAAEALDKVVFTTAATNTGGGRGGAKVTSHGTHAYFADPIPLEKHPDHGGSGEVG